MSAAWSMSTMQENGCASTLRPAVRSERWKLRIRDMPDSMSCFKTGITACGKRVDAPRYIAALSRGLIAECAYVQGVVGLYVKGLFVVDKIGYGHIGVGRNASLKF